MYPVHTLLNLYCARVELQDQAEAEVVVAVVRRVVVPVRHAAVPGVVVPAAATVHAVRAEVAPTRKAVAATLEAETAGRESADWSADDDSTDGGGE